MSATQAAKARIEQELEKLEQYRAMMAKQNAADERRFKLYEERQRKLLEQLERRQREAESVDLARYVDSAKQALLQEVHNHTGRIVTNNGSADAIAAAFAESDRFVNETMMSFLRDELVPAAIQRNETAVLAALAAANKEVSPASSKKRGAKEQLKLTPLHDALASIEGPMGAPFRKAQAVLTKEQRAAKALERKKLEKKQAKLQQQEQEQAQQEQAQQAQAQEQQQQQQPQQPEQQEQLADSDDDDGDDDSADFDEMPPLKSVDDVGSDYSFSDDDVAVHQLHEHALHEIDRQHAYLLQPDEPLDELHDVD
jgi:hypothetical protein